MKVQSRDAVVLAYVLVEDTDGKLSVILVHISDIVFKDNLLESEKNETEDVKEAIKGGPVGVGNHAVYTYSCPECGRVVSCAVKPLKGFVRYCEFCGQRLRIGDKDDD